MTKDQQRKQKRYRCDVCDFEFFESDQKKAYEKFMKHSELKSHVHNIVEEMTRL